jgi:large subunit ribosomal protein L33
MARKDRNQTNRLQVTLSCTVCGSRNYKTTKARSDEEGLSLKKFCRVCNAHTIHIDSK